MNGNNNVHFLKNINFFIPIIKGWKGILHSFIIGLLSFSIYYFFKNPILDPLLISLSIGIILSSFIKFDKEAKIGLKLTFDTLIPFGAIFYGAANLNFSTFKEVDIVYIFMIFIVFLLYIISIILLSNIFNINDKTGYLIAAGSAICGASAIAITSKSIDSKPDDISHSLIPIYIIGLLGLFIILPSIEQYFKLSKIDYGILSGTVLQFTGFVKAASSNFSNDIKSITLTVKALRYVGLIFIIPLFASIIKGKIHIPWYLFAFLIAGIIFNLTPDIAKIYKPLLKIILNIFWSISMAAIGLNSSLKTLLTKNGLKCLIISLTSFLLVIFIFIIGIKII